MVPPVRPLAPAVGLRPSVSSLAPTVAPLLFPVSELLSSGSSSSHFAPSHPSVPAASHLQASVPASPFSIISSASSASVISWSLPVVVSCSFPSVASLAAVAHSLVPPVVSLGSLAPPPPSLLPTVASFLSVPPAPPSSFASSGAPRVLHSALDVLALPLRGVYVPLARLALFLTVLGPLTLVMILFSRIHRNLSIHIARFSASESPRATYQHSQKSKFRW